MTVVRTTPRKVNQADQDVLAGVHPSLIATPWITTWAADVEIHPNTISSVWGFVDKNTAVGIGYRRLGDGPDPARNNSTGTGSPLGPGYAIFDHYVVDVPDEGISHTLTAAHYGVFRFYDNWEWKAPLSFLFGWERLATGALMEDRVDVDQDGNIYFSVHRNQALIGYQTGLWSAEGQGAYFYYKVNLNGDATSYGRLPTIDGEVEFDRIYYHRTAHQLLINMIGGTEDSPTFVDGRYMTILSPIAAPPGNAVDGTGIASYTILAHDEYNAFEEFNGNGYRTMVGSLRDTGWLLTSYERQTFEKWNNSLTSMIWSVPAGLPSSTSVGHEIVPDYNGRYIQTDGGLAPGATFGSFMWVDSTDKPFRASDRADTIEGPDGNYGQRIGFDGEIQYLESNQYLLLGGDYGSITSYTHALRMWDRQRPVYVWRIQPAPDFITNTHRIWLGFQEMGLKGGMARGTMTSEDKDVRVRRI